MPVVIKDVLGIHFYWYLYGHYARRNGGPCNVTVHDDVVYFSWVHLGLHKARYVDYDMAQRKFIGEVTPEDEITCLQTFEIIKPHL
jgi:hypothetical protein